MNNHISSFLRRGGAILLALALLAVLLPTSAFALTGTQGDLTWSLTGGVLSVSGSGPIPDYTDENMAPWYYVASGVNRILVGDGITEIGNLAFYGCENADLARLPASVTRIGDRAFKNCCRLSQLGRPAGLVEIGEAAFESCTALKALALPDGLRTIGHYAFTRAGLTSVTIPASVTDFGMVVFAYCTSLVRAKIACPITKLPDWTFYGCTALTDVSLPETVTETGEYALEKCENLTGLYYDGAANLAPADKNEDLTVNPAEDYPSSGSSYTETPSGGQTTTVTDTGDATITQETDTDYSYTLNGEDATLDDLLNSNENDNIDVDSSTTTVISAEVKNDEGWDQVIDTVVGAVRGSNDLTVEIRLPEPEISGKKLSDLSGKDAEVTIITPVGNEWKLSGSDLRKKDFSNRDYDLDFTVTKQEENKTDIPGSTVYEIKFNDHIDFKAKVGIPVMAADKRQYASLYQLVGGKLTLIQSVIVDDQARAWFALSGVDKGVKYYVGINVDGVERSEAVIPEGLYTDYGVNTLTDSSGVHYQITGRQSSWNMGLGKVMLILAAVLVGSFVLIGIVMTTLNRRAQKKMRTQNRNRT